MTRILGLVGSARPWGNSELMVRQVLQGTTAEGVTGHLIRLTNLDLEPCTGCMRCVIGDKPCRISDDMVWLIQAIQAADGLVLAAPTYFLGPAAVIKLVLDRMLMVTGQMTDAPPGRCHRHRRPGRLAGRHATLPQRPGRRLWLSPHREPDSHRTRSRRGIAGWRTHGPGPCIRPPPGKR